MKSPFPYAGGKRMIADEVWKRLGNPPNYVEPFFGSGAVLLNRPHAPNIETVNDKDAFVSNFFRAVKYAPLEVAKWADEPINEIDLHAKRRWLLNNPLDVERMIENVEYYDAKVAGWWVWCVCLWIGTSEINTVRQIFTKSFQGVLRKDNQNIYTYIQRLSMRLKGIRIACGEWNRILGETFTTSAGLTAVFLDPPYTEGAEGTYGVSDTDKVAYAAYEWAIANADNPLLRIAFCGYEGTFTFPSDWECLEWKANGGYSNRNPDNQNAHRERIWFSPNCLKPMKNLTLFDMEILA